MAQSGRRPGGILDGGRMESSASARGDALKD
jgi:hypothetical protein